MKNNNWNSWLCNFILYFPLYFLGLNTLLTSCPQTPSIKVFLILLKYKSFSSALNMQDF
jgi:hypothetical protein